MKKIGMFALTAIMVMSFAVAAQAVVINTPWPVSGIPEVNLFQVINNMTGLSITNAQLEAQVPLETLAAGGYTLLDFAKYAGFSQKLDVPSGNLLTLASSPLVQTGSPGTKFTEAAAFAFTDFVDGLTPPTNPKSTIAADNSPLGFQSNGFIFDLESLATASGFANPSKFHNQFIVAFEDGDNNQPLGDKDYNDLVARVVVPVPPSALLMGSGLLGLGLLGWRRRFFG